MLDDFFVRALLAGIGIAVVAGPLGCFVVWRRMAYFGDTMAHSALLGIALALAFDWATLPAVFLVSALVSMALVLLQRRGGLSTDSLLGILSHSSLAIGLVSLAFMPGVRVDLLGYLFGDILAVTKTDLAVVWGGAVVVAAALALLWRPLLAGTVNAEVAAAEGQAPERARILFMLLLAFVIAIAMKIVGILLITALLIIPAATARRFATSPEVMALSAAVIGAFASGGGLYLSLGYDTPSGPSIVVAALGLFLLALLPLPKLSASAGKPAASEPAP
ncbi:metal ABC transporter permease [Jiella sonneratiae]|uniref:High-affinity zinc uptake system membrane protein ZnuB n=1 Tax=Jiella sonneratiae TaxID=2816856 RepID=A0ABS3IYP9_9HYPH|nr:metal ABC transporter permease [Jiella sonneratiae]MBO0902541.1 metal ABC transporter permease [Jiella sonneratiae]